MKRHFHIAFLLAIVVLAYSNTLVDSFTLDDKIYIDLNPQVTDASLRGLFAANKLANVFRPLTFATLALNWKVGGTRPFGYHLFNLLLHGAATLLFYFLLEAIFFELSQGAPSPRDKLVAFAAALIFAVHPIHTEAVSSIVGRAEILAAGFIFAAWILHLKDRPIPALICFALALLSKESAVVFLPLLLVGDYARGKWKPRLSYALVTC